MNMQIFNKDCNLVCMGVFLGLFGHERPDWPSCLFDIGFDEEPERMLRT